MSNKELIMTLGKVIIAAAWADGEITFQEVNCLKDLLFRMPHIGSDQEMQLTAQEWAELEIYIDSPVDEAERARLVEELRVRLRNPQERELVLSTLDALIKADGVVTEAEQAVVTEIKQALETVDLSLIGQVSRLIQGPLQRRSQAVANAPNREAYLEDYIKNKIYYKVRRRLNLAADALNTSESDLRKLSLAGGLMARVAHVDQVVTDGEVTTMIEALQRGWSISEEAAALVAEVAVSEMGIDLDYFRLVREFFSSTSHTERVDFLDTLFAVAAADGEISAQESREIRHISRDLNMTQQQFVAAKDKTA